MKTKRKKRSKGFTLVELLAVIVILAVVMLIAVTAVGPIIDRARKQSFVLEGKALVKAAKNAHQTMTIDGSLEDNTSVCFDMAYLCQNGYYEKGCNGRNNGDGYFGAVLVRYNTSEKSFTYKYWIGNNTYYIGIPEKNTNGKWSNRFPNCTYTKGKDASKDVSESEVKKMTTSVNSSGLEYMRRCGAMVANVDDSSKDNYYALYYSTDSSANADYKEKIVNCFYRTDSNNNVFNTCVNPVSNSKKACQQ